MTDTVDAGAGADPYLKVKNTEFLEIGSSGLVQFGGEVKDEFLRSLQGQTGYRTYREMADNDPVVGAILHAIDMLVRSTDWRMEASDPDNPRSIEAAEFVSGCLDDMSQSWTETLSGILTMLVYGFSYHEIVYKRREGYKDDGTRSAYSDGRIGWRKLAYRSQETCDGWELGSDGGVEGMYQQDPSVSGNRGRVFIPIEKALLFRTMTAKANPRGRSILRNAFTTWYFKRRIVEIEAIGIERDLAGMPVALVPPQLLSDNATPEEAAALTQIKKIVRNIKRDEQEGIVFPLAHDPDTGHLAYDLKLLSTGGSRSFDTDKIINRYDQRIAMTVLADFILLGHEKVGTQALSVSKIQLFSDSLNAWLKNIAAVLNTYAIPRLMRLNGFDPDVFPSLRFDPSRNVDINVIGDYVAKLAGAGAALFPDESLEDHLREIAGLPGTSDID